MNLLCGHVVVSHMGRYLQFFVISLYLYLLDYSYQISENNLHLFGVMDCDEHGNDSVRINYNHLQK
jgi:hypothetical protein